MDPDVRAFYAEAFREDDRLRRRAQGVLERVRARELLARFLPSPPAVVLDVSEPERRSSPPGPAATPR